MTKADRARIVAWRLRILQHAENEPRYVAQTCRYFGISRTAFYRWKKRFDENGEAGLADRPRTPHLNGKVERSHRINEQEFYQLIDQNGISDDIHLFNEKLREWEDYYNYHRPHGALQGRTSYEQLIEKSRADVSQGS